MTGNQPRWLKCLATLPFIFWLLSFFLPNDLYVLFRFVLCGTALYAAWYAYQGGQRGWSSWMLLAAVLFNPILPPVHLTRGIWDFVTFIVAMSFLEWAGFWRPIGAFFTFLRMPWNKQLRGPNSSITTILVRPKWNAILRSALKLPMKGWTFEWKYTRLSDLISGMSLIEAEHSYYTASVGEKPLLNVTKDTENLIGLDEDKHFKFNLFADGPKERVRIWGETHQKHNRSPHVLTVWCDSPDKEPAPLGVFLLDDVLRELKRMDSVVVGASLRNPIDVGHLTAFVLLLDDLPDVPAEERERMRKKAILDYVPEFNPIGEDTSPRFEPLRGYHIFENEFLIMAVQHRTFRGAFTRIPDYSDDSVLAPSYRYGYGYGDLLNEMLVKYYGNSAATVNSINGIYQLLAGFDGLWFQCPRPRVSLLEEDAALDRERQAWAERRGRVIEKLSSFRNRIWLTPVESSKVWVTCLELPFFLRDLYDELKDYEEDTMMGQHRIILKDNLETDLGKEQQVILQHPKGNIVMRALEVSSKNYEQSEIAGRPVREIILNMGGKPVLRVIYHEHVEGRRNSQVGRILECAPGEWPLRFLQAALEIKTSQSYFDTLVARQRRHKKALEETMKQFDKQREEKDKQSSIASSGS